ncbi:uncharacterized protein LOC122964359 [Acropora millepora]|uniref:uncharacterized protein LOC122964359 n=1 Tax=Acropora millepora TaxID=45264 RepID=UPI001CF5B71A|nr:uncharacterized protein LOC122964359 [Acropora millepora]
MDEPDKEKVYLNAIGDINERGLSVRKAAKKWDIAKSTLHDRLGGKAKNIRRGPQTVLTHAEEDRFAEWLIERAKRGFGATKDEFLDCVEAFIQKDKRETKFTGNRPGNKWYRGFVKRNPKVRLRSARPLDKKRAKITPEEVDEWFANFEKFIQDVGLAGRPGQIWNCDETGFDLQGRAGKVLGPASSKEQPYRVITGTKEHITVLPCFNATGQCIPPYMLFPGKRIPNQYNLLEGGVPGSCYSLTEKGYMDTATFYTWLEKHFIPNLPPARPVVLLVDSAGAHIDLDTFELAKRNDVFIYALLKNATHLVQPADVGLFGAMKQSWYKNVRRYSQQNPNTDITKKNFSSIFKKTWEDAMRPSILVDSFRKSGVYPINRQQISYDHVRPSIVYAGTSTNLSPGEPSTAPSVFGEQAAALALASLSHPLQSTPLGAMSSSLLQQSATVNQLPVSQQTVPLGAMSSQLPQQSATINSFPVSQMPLGAIYTPLQFPVQQPGGAVTAAFVAFESALQSPVRVKYRRRVDEGYDLPGSPTYEVWKKLHTVSLTSIGNPPDVSSTPQIPETQSVSAVNFADESPTSVFSDTRCHPPRVATEVSPVLQEVLTYPSAPESNKTKKNKRSLPNFMNSEDSLRIMRDEKLKKAREVAAKQKKLREREERKEAIRKEKEDKKRKMEEKKRVKEKSSTIKKAKKRKVSQSSKGKQWRQGLTLGENICKVCLCEYDEADVENMPWVMCDECKYWMHIDCIPLGVDITSIENGDNFFCHDCM